MILHFCVSTFCHITVQNMHLDKNQPRFGFERETEGGWRWQAEAHPGSWLVCWRGLLCWCSWAPDGIFVTNIIQGKHIVNNFFIAGITLILDSVRGREAVYPWASGANCRQRWAAWSPICISILSFSVCFAEDWLTLITFCLAPTQTAGTLGCSSGTVPAAKILDFFCKAVGWVLLGSK